VNNSSSEPAAEGRFYVAGNRLMTKATGVAVTAEALTALSISRGSFTKGTAMLAIEYEARPCGREATCFERILRLRHGNHSERAGTAA